MYNYIYLYNYTVLGVDIWLRGMSLCSVLCSMFDVMVAACAGMYKRASSCSEDSWLQPSARRRCLRDDDATRSLTHTQTSTQRPTLT